MLDRHGAVAFAGRLPERVFADFEAIPPLVVDSLLFIENRELLDAGTPRRNPAVEWDRLADPPARRSWRALAEPGAQARRRQHARDPDGEVPALARSAGPTSAKAKLRQMASASLRAYLDGPETTTARHQIVVDYLNSTPLSARAGLGEINGLGDGLWAWFGTDFAHASRVLHEPAPSPEALAREGADLQAGAEPAAGAAAAVLLPGRRARRACPPHRQLSPPAAGRRRDRRRAGARPRSPPSSSSRPRRRPRGSAVRRSQGRQRDPHRAPDAARPAAASTGSTASTSRSRPRSICRPSARVSELLRQLNDPAVGAGARPLRPPPARSPARRAIR